ncbi:MAG: FAD-binding oxidoreductase [Pseudomonadota bacterium]
MAFQKSIPDSSFDVVIVGGAMIGSSIAWHLKKKLNYQGSVLVVEADPTYDQAATSHTNSCVRQQFSTEINIQISQFMGEVVSDFPAYCEDPDAPNIPVNFFGYMYLGDTDSKAAALTEAADIQRQNDVPIQLLSADEISDAYPFYNTEDVKIGAHNLQREGYFDGALMFDYWRSAAMRAGAIYLHDKVVDLKLTDGAVSGVDLKANGPITAKYVINCAGTRSADIAAMAGQDIPVEARKRMTYIFTAETPLDQDLPLTIDPSGIHVRWDGHGYLAGCPDDPDPAVAHGDFTVPQHIWETRVWPVLAHRIPAFEAIKVTSEWAGHYDFNTWDQNALLGQFRSCPNLINASGFSGHGLQQSAAVGRGIAELVVFGEYRSLDLSELSVNRVAEGRKFIEKAVI